MSSLRQLSISVARALADGQDAATRAALVKDLGTRFEQESVELAAELLDHVDGVAGSAPAARDCLAAARVHSPLFTLRGGTNEVLRGVVAKSLERAPAADEPDDELGQLVDDIGRRSFDQRDSAACPNAFDEQLWQHARGHRAEPTDHRRRARACGESAVVLARAGPVGRRGARRRNRSARSVVGHARPGSTVPADGPLTVAIADTESSGARITGTATDVPWPGSGPRAAGRPHADGLSVAVARGPRRRRPATTSLASRAASSSSTCPPRTRCGCPPTWVTNWSPRRVGALRADRRRLRRRHRS